MNETTLSQGTKDWLVKVETKVDRVLETAIKTEAKLDSINDRTTDIEHEQKSFELRLSDLENKFSALRGAFKAFAIVGGIVVALIALSEVLILLIKM